jgi:hypothetical protein
MQMAATIALDVFNFVFFRSLNKNFFDSIFLQTWSLK